MGKNKKRKMNATTAEDSLLSNKRARSILSEAEDGSVGFYKETPRVDPSSGLRTAFPGLEEDDHGQPFYGPANDGLDYLRMVRSEARGVPSLLVAPKNHEEMQDEETYNTGRSDTRAYYQDGAYTALSLASSGSPGISSADVLDDHPQDLYHQSLVLRYQALRANLRISPPQHALDRLDDEHPINFAGNLREQYSKWRNCLRTTDPLPGQIAVMDQQTVLRLVKLLATGFLKRKHNIKVRVGRWIWVLLGRLEEIGCLSSEEVSIVRDLGKRAVWVLLGIRKALDNGELDGSAEQADGDGFVGGEGEMIREREDLDEAEPSTDGVDADISVHPREDTGAKRSYQEPSEDVGHVWSKQEQAQDLEEGEVTEDNVQTEGVPAENNVAAVNPPTDVSARCDDTVTDAKTRLLAQLSHTDVYTEPKQDEQFPSPDTTATLNMIITIVGEVYGQRDLLEFREVWGEFD